MYDVYEWNKTKLSSDLGFFFCLFFACFFCCKCVDQCTCLLIAACVFFWFFCLSMYFHVAFVCMTVCFVDSKMFIEENAVF